MPMYICKVVGKVVATIRNPRLGPYSLLLVRRLGTDNDEDRALLVAADPIGCGDGDTILVTQGANAQFALPGNTAPIDLAVVGIVDSYTENNAAEPRAPKIGTPSATQPSTSKKTNKL